ncbi:unnamed protein product [Clavelina lepadiformis]|uniref:PiggyBac transposable element-derived protein domain-containing protein n=1 Tax=Clavelina lepadiformis TaxID=159417 RepID=A0ABP0FSX5_CLALP
MAARRFSANDVLEMLDSEDENNSDMEVDEESDFSDSDMEMSYDGSSDPDEHSDSDGSTSNDVVDSNGWRVWHDNDSDFPHHPFTATDVGPNLEKIPETELEYFQNFMSDEIFMEILVATNAYATIRLQKKRFVKSSVWYGWQDLTLPELKKICRVKICRLYRGS